MDSSNVPVALQEQLGAQATAGLLRLFEVERTEWTQDVMRHSYASYWLAQHGDINQLTLQMGHENPDMLWKHYHKASKRKDAQSYWKIMPCEVRQKIVPIAIKGARA